MLARFSLFQKSLVLVLIPLVVQFFFVMVLTNMLKQADLEIKQEHHSRVLISHLNRLNMSIIASASRIMLPNSKGSSAPEDAIQDQFDLLKKFEKDPKLLKAIVKTEKQWQEGLVSAIRLKKAVKREQKLTVFVELNKLRDDLDQIYERLNTVTEAAMDVIKKSPRKQIKRRKQIREFLYYGLTINLTIAVLLVWFFNKSTTQRLKQLMVKAKQIEEGKTLSSIEAGKDEISELDSVLFEVADKLNKSRIRVKETDSRIRSILETIPSGIVILRKEGEIDYVNQTMEELFLTPQLKFVGSSITDHLSISMEELNTFLDRGITNSTTKDSIESLAIKDNNQQFPVEITSREIDWSDDKKRFLIALEDISERKRVEKLRSDFTAMITHNVRSPLNSLLAFLELLSRGKYGTLNEKGKGSIETVERAIDLIVTLISDLLDLDKIEAGLLELHRTDTSNTEIVSRSITAVKSLAELKQIELVSKVETVELCVDQGRLIQVLVNLVSNAVNHCDKGSKIEVVSQVEEEFVRFSVNDNGPGIPEDKLPTIFERFTQVSSMKKGGSGLGLTISKALVEEHNGKIGVTSEHGKGSSFWFVVPLSKSW